ncbi:MAG TPA: hypothetical protein O0Y17_04960, partial [Methanocorpusculum sp.]|nr:hypothetical protein [Methanocorpusculum sp.]
METPKIPEAEKPPEILKEGVTSAETTAEHTSDEKIGQNTISEGTNPQTPKLTEPAQEISAVEPAPKAPPVKEHYASDEYDTEIFGGVRFDTTADIP